MSQGFGSDRGGDGNGGANSCGGRCWIDRPWDACGCGKPVWPPSAKHCNKAGGSTLIRTWDQTQAHANKFGHDVVKRGIGSFFGILRGNLIRWTAGAPCDAIADVDGISPKPTRACETALSAVPTSLSAVGAPPATPVAAFLKQVGLPLLHPRA